MRFADAQFLTFFARLLKDHAEIVSGAYRFRRTQQGVEGGGWRDLTDDEKLKMALATMDRRIEFMQQIEDRLGGQESEARKRAGTACSECGKPYDAADMDGGRCLGCMTAIAAEAPSCPEEGCERLLLPWPKSSWHGPQAWHCPKHGGPIRLGEEPEAHLLIFGRIEEPIGCCSLDGMKDVLAEEPDAKFKPVDPDECPICKREF